MLKKFRQFLRAARSVLILPLLVLIAGPAPDAQAQGGQGLVAEPIRSSDFNQSIKRLDPDYAQRIAIEAEHEQYKERYRLLREGEIAALIRETHEMQRSGFGMPDRKQVEDLFKTRKSVQDRIARVDQQLFDSMAAHLREDQMPALARLRRARERERYEIDMVTGPFGGNRVNLLHLVDELDLPDDVYAAVDGPLVVYENSINSALRTLHDKSISFFLDLFTVLEEMGFTEESAEDPDAMMAMMEAMRKAMEKISGDLMDAANAVHEVTERSQSRIAMVLPADFRERFEELYLQRTYPDVYNDWESPAAVFESLKESAEVTDSQKAELAAAEEHWQTSWDSISRRMKDVRDDQRKSRRSPWDGFMGADTGDHQQKFDELQQERRSLNQRTFDRITTIVGKDKTEQFRHGQVGHAGTMIASIATEVQGEVVAQAEAQLEEDVHDLGGWRWPSRGADHILPGMIGDWEFSMYAQRLDLSPDQRIIGEDFLREYQEEYRKLNEERIPEILLEPKRRAQEAEGELLAAAAQEIADGRQRAMRLLLDLDRDFFAELDALLNAGQRSRLPAIRRARERIVYDLGPYAMTERPDGNVDYPRLVYSLGLSAEEVKLLEAAIAEFEQKILPVLRQQHEAVIEQEVRQVEAQRLVADLQGDFEQNPRAAMEAWQKYEELMQSVQERLRELGKARAQVEADAAPAIRRALPAHAAAKFDEQMRQLRYPDIFPDHGNADRAVRSALELEGLTAHQRGTLEMILDEHARRHVEFCNGMVELADVQAKFGQYDWSSNDPEEFVEYQRRQMKMELLRYDREELNETTRRRVRALLRENLAALVRGLEVEADREG